MSAAHPAASCVEQGRALKELGRGALLGMLLGVLAWGEGRTPLLALLLPMLVATRDSRAEAACTAAGYALGLMRHSAAFVAAWFEGNDFVAVAVLALCCAVTAAVWCVGWSAAGTPWARIGRMLAPWALALLPPFALAIPGHPILAVGFLLPGAGWPGVLLSVTSCGIAGLVGPNWGGQSSIRRGFAVLAVLLGLGSVLTAPAAPHSAVRGVVAMNTAWGALNGAADTLARLERMARAELPPNARVVVWPESILGRYDPALNTVLRLELLAPSARAARVQVVGMDLPTADGRLRNAAVAFHPDGKIAIAFARQPVPLALWRPWSAGTGFVADWGASHTLALGQGDQAAVIFCYEEYLPLLFLLQELREPHAVYLVLANTWAARDPASAAIQTAHSRGMALLFARDYLKAENRPPAMPAADWPASFAY